jgi:hypothetical protein
MLFLKSAQPHKNLATYILSQPVTKSPSKLLEKSKTKFDGYFKAGKADKIYVFSKNLEARFEKMKLLLFILISSISNSKQRLYGPASVNSQSWEFHPCVVEGDRVCRSIR